MNLFEAGVIAGAPAGAAIGGVICKSYGISGVVGGLFVGFVAGGVAGWLYAATIIFLMSVIGVLWRAARKQGDRPPDIADMELMTPIGIRGSIVGILIGAVTWFSYGWLHALGTAMAVGLVTGCIGVARCSSRHAA
ncbi:MAG: hypothetical protein WA705_05165 [Candidatus Ozemobacteraceae bacterium]